MIRWIFKWLFRLFLLAAVLMVILLLSLNSIVRVAMEHNIRSQMGMDAEIGRVKVGLLEPTFEIQDLKIYNTPDFGGTPFLDIAEIHAEYDRVALAKKQIHLTLLRFNLTELDIVKDRSGRLNTSAIGNPPQKKGVAAPSVKRQTGYDFKGIDALNVSFNKAKYFDLQNPTNNREQIFGIQNCVVPDVKSANDLAGLIFLIDLRSNHFFDGLIVKPKNSSTLQSILNLIGVML
jgi:hypothetical protein